MLQEHVHFHDESFMAPLASLAIDCPVGLSRSGLGLCRARTPTIWLWAAIP